MLVHVDGWLLTKQKLLCLLKLLRLHLHLECSKRLKGKLKKGEERDWNASKELRSVRYVYRITWFQLSLLSCPFLNCSEPWFIIELHIQAKALAEKNQRDLQVQRDQAERHVSGWNKYSFSHYYCLFYSFSRLFFMWVFIGI